MDFTIETWRERVTGLTRHLGDRLTGLKPKKEDVPYLLYGTLCSMSLWPLVEAARQPGGYVAVMGALGGVVGGVGADLLANQVQRWKERTDGPDEAEVARWVAEQINNAELRTALDTILEKLDAIPTAQTGLSETDREWFTETLRGELNRLGNLPRFLYVQTYIDQRQVVHVHEGLPADPARLEASYLRRVQVTCNALPLAVIDPRAVERTRQQTMDLLAVYVDLNTRTQVAVEKGKGKGKRGKREEIRVMADPERETQPLSALEAVATEKRMVLLGDPGSGKSTFANYLALCLAGGWLERMGEKPEIPGEKWLTNLEPAWTHGPLLPLQVTLRHFAGSKSCDGTAAGLWSYIADTLATQELADFAPYLRQELLNGGVMVLLDGLDEVADPKERQAVRDAVADFAATYSGNRYLVTCRGYAYQDPCWQLEGVPTHTLAPFNQEQIDAFIHCWYQEVCRRGWKSESEAGDLTQRLQAATRRPDLAVLAGNPLQLAMMASLHFSWGTLPDDRVRLYQQMVELLLVRWQEGRLGEDVGVTRAVSADKLELALEQVAFEVHSTQAGREGTADIGEATLRGVLKDCLDGSWDRAGDLVDYIQQRAGLLIERGPGVYTFPHRSYQEYLAGSYLAVQPDFPDEAARLIRDNYAQWREVVLWSTGVMARLNKMIHVAVDVAVALCPGEVPDQKIPEGDWRMAHVAGETLLETGLEEVKSRARYKPVLDRVRRWLEALVERGALTPVERASAGRLLAKLGDRRPGVGAVLGADGRPTLPDMEFCYVPAGPFWMGSEEFEGEKPVRRADIAYDYWMSRYPVTNRQFQLFVEAGGYDKPHYWPGAEAAEVWRAGEGVKGDFDGTWRKALQDFGEPYNLPNHPAVGVTWYEALAFTRWLEERISEEANQRTARSVAWAVRLPSEAEWEKAARGGLEIPKEPLIARVGGPGCAPWEVEMRNGVPRRENPRPRRRYPWEGDEPDPDRANCDDTGIGTTSAVGCFPKGASPYGCLDMAGNVWEWTRSVYGDYPYRPTDGREDLAAGTDVLRVLRGGAFYNYEMLVRCAFRFRLNPHYLNGPIGFRVVWVASI